MPKRRLAVDETDKPSVTKNWLLTKFSNIENLMKPFKPIYVHNLETPVGKAVSAADDSFVYIFAFEGSSMLDKRFSQVCKELGVSKVLESSNKLLKQLEVELKAYFDGDLQKFTVPIKYVGTQFQQDVWDKLIELPYGVTQTYGDLAKMMGVPVSHSRAIGNACGNNALLVLVPCHRLVAAGSKGGYNSGKDRKEWLINHEKKYMGMFLRCAFSGYVCLGQTFCKSCYTVAH